MVLKCENCGNCETLQTRGNPGHSLALFRDCKGGMNRAREINGHKVKPLFPQDVDPDVLTQINAEGMLREQRRKLLRVLLKRI